MGVVMWTWVAVLGLVTLVWLTRHVELARARRRMVVLSEDQAGQVPADPPRISVLVAARNEQDNIATCVTTWLRQDWPDYELIVINDRSTDGTQGIVEQIARTDANGSRLRLLNVTELPAGWAGKNNAMRMGVEAAQGDWLLFSDADCRQTSDRTITAAINHCLQNNIDMLSVLPVLEAQTAWERIIQPAAGAVMVFWFNPRRVNDPGCKAAYANGAFMLMTRRAYETIGGHGAVRGALNEDLHMAVLAKQKGLRLRVVQNDGLYVTRMYRNFAETWRGWSRIFHGCFGTVRQLTISAGFLTVMSLLPWISLLAGWAAVAAGAADPTWRLVAWAATAAIVAQMTVLVRFYRASKADARYVPTWPIAAALCVGMLISAIFKTLGWTGTAWRGRVYRVGQAAARQESRT